MKKVLFIDRDGTIIFEPEDEQIDSLEKLEFLPEVIINLHKIASELDYQLVMVTNQDGLGTDSFPEETFWPAHEKMLKTLADQGINFSKIHIDRTFPDDNANTRKPDTGMLTEYLEGDYDLSQSYVIGDRPSDVELAKNLGAKAIYLSDQQDASAALTTTSWPEIYRYLKLPVRRFATRRSTKETEIYVAIQLDGSGKAAISTGIAFFDHMLEQIARHGLIDLEIEVKGDLEVDEHHTIEDTAITLGEAFAQVLGDKKGIERYGFCLPMDDSLAQVAVDFGGRSWLVWEADFKREMIGKMPTEMFFHFFKSFSDAAKCNLNIKVDGTNEHHKIEAVFKAFAKAIKIAVRRDISNDTLPSTKGML